MDMCINPGLIFQICVDYLYLNLNQFINNGDI